MTEMTSRERVLRTVHFQETDRAPFDLMESVVWPELQEWYTANMGLTDKNAVLDHFDVDFRWFWATVEPPADIDINDPKYTLPYTATYSDHTQARPLANVTTIGEMLSKHEWMDPTWWKIKPVHRLRAQHPDKAIVVLLPHTCPFMTSCDFFGIEEALMRLQCEDEVYLAFIKRQNEFVAEVVKHTCREAQGVADFCWLMDDIASQRSLLMNPASWRRHFKEPLRRHVEIIHEHGLHAIYHSCGAVREVIPDFVEIGMDAMEPFQTTADGMDAESIARDFGGKMAFYGGIDIQQLLTFGTEEDARREVRRNAGLFARCGGYVVSNSHHCIENVKGENITAMLDEARRYRTSRAR